MRYLALLFDSIREALDSKVIYVTVALSFVLILLVAGIQFRPVTVEDEAERLAGTLNWIFSLQTQGPFKKSPPECKVVEFKKLNPKADLWNADYQFAFLLKLPPEMANAPDGQEKRFLMQALVSEEYWYLKDRTIKESVTKDGREVRLEVTAHGTKIDSLQSWPHQPSLGFGLVPLSWWFRSSLTYSVYWIENRLVNTIGGWAIVIISVIVTAGFIPNMLQRGTVDLLLVKPISRVMLLIFKYLGGLAFVFVNSLIAIGGVWLALGVRTGIWTWSFPITVLILTCFFAILYAVSTLFAVLTRNAVICIFMTCLVWLTLFVIGWLHAAWNAPPADDDSPIAELKKTKSGPFAPDQSLESVKRVVETLHFVLPRTDDLGRLTTQLISHELLSKEERRKRGFREEEPFTWGESLAVSGIFIVVLLGLACWRFAVRDY